MDQSDSSRRNPSRATCEETIRRILMTEVLQNGKNRHFKTAMDFMNYFESLYLPGPALTKQVQRAVRAMDMPKDADGYFLVNKTKSQLSQDQEITHLMEKADAAIVPMGDMTPVFLKCDQKYAKYLMQLISDSDTLKDKYLTILPSSEGLIFLSDQPNVLELILSGLLP